MLSPQTNVNCRHFVAVAQAHRARVALQPGAWGTGNLIRAIFGVTWTREQRYAGSGRILRRRKYLPPSPGRQEAPVGRLGRCLAGILHAVVVCLHRRVPRQALRRSVAAGVAWCASGRRCSVLISAKDGRGAGCANLWRTGFMAAPPTRHSAGRGCLRQRRTARTRPCSGERT